MKKLAVVALACAALAPAQTKSATCDRTCLEGFVDQYMDALIAHDPKKLPTTATVKNTENGQRLTLGDGYWRTATAKGTYRLFASDPQTGQVTFMGTMREAPPPSMAVPVIVAIRLKVANRQVSEIETIVVRDMAAANTLDMLAKPNQLFLDPIPAADRMTRQDLTKVAEMYMAGIEKNDGKGVYPFADDCDRVQNGTQTTNNPNYRPPAAAGSAAGGRGAAKGKGPVTPPPPPPAVSPTEIAAKGCKAQFETGYYHFVNRIRDRRIVTVDTERGLIVAFDMMDMGSGPHQHVKLTDGRETTAGPTHPQTLEVAELFRIEKGKIRRIEAVQDEVPYGMSSGWGN